MHIVGCDVVSDQQRKRVQQVDVEREEWVAQMQVGNDCLLLNEMQRVGQVVSNFVG